MLVGGEDQSIGCLGYLPVLGNIAPTFLQALSKKQGWQVDFSTSLVFCPSFHYLCQGAASY